MWIWQCPQWPEFSFDATALQAPLVAARMAQGRLAGVAQQLQLIDASQLQLTRWSQEALATAQIEGEVLQLNSVRSSAARRLGLAFETAAGKDVRAEATLDVMEAAAKNWAQPLNHQDLFAWHAALFPTGYSGIMRIAVGNYRTHAEPMQIVTQKLGRNDQVHYQAPASKDVPQHMKALLTWLNKARISGQRAETDGLIRAAIAHLWFEIIHPFEDGNGRIGRALMERCLAQDMQSEQRLFSLSHQFWLDRSGYYAQLQSATTRDPLDTQPMDITPWISWFLGCVEKACAESLGQMSKANEKNRLHLEWHRQHPDLSKAQIKLLFRLLEARQTHSTAENPSGFVGGMSTEKYVALTGVSRATAYRDLSDLVVRGLLSVSGQGRGTRYSLSD
jgi:Fic family protein